jgi:hypothetical protein
VRISVTAKDRPGGVGTNQAEMDFYCVLRKDVKLNRRFFVFLANPVQIFMQGAVNTTRRATLFFQLTTSPFPPQASGVHVAPDVLFNPSLTRL